MERVNCRAMEVKCHKKLRQDSGSVGIIRLPRGAMPVAQVEV